MPVDLDDLLGKAYSVEEAAGILGISAEAVRRLIRRKLLKAVRPKARRNYTILGEDLVLYLTAGKGTSTMAAIEAHRVKSRLGKVLAKAKPRKITEA